MIGTFRQMAFALFGKTQYARLQELLSQEMRPMEELRRKQFQHLSSLLRYAYDTVPYYREVFENLKIQPKDIRSFEDFQSFPMITRQDIEDNRERMISSACPEEERFLNFSGGTSGRPLKFYQDYGLLRQMAADFLFSISFAGWTPDDMIVSIWGNARELISTEIKSNLRTWITGQRLLNSHRYGKDDMQAWLEVLKKYRRVFVYGYVSALTDLADYMYETGQRLNTVAAVMTTAERLYTPQRERIADTFGCRVHDQYGSREVPGISVECACGNMHLLTHSVYTEFAPLRTEDEESLPVRETEGGVPLQRLVITGLTNKAMPLIRYANGDFGAPKDGHCLCGRGYPLMHMGIGRVVGSLRGIDGKRHFGHLFVLQLLKLEGITNFQFRQTASDLVHLYVVKGANFTQASADGILEVQQRFPVNLCPGVQLQVSYVSEVPRTSGGKHQHVVYDLPA